MRPTTVAFLLGAFVWVLVGAVLMGALCAGKREDEARLTVSIFEPIAPPRDEGRALLDDIADGYELAQRAEASVHGAER